MALLTVSAVASAAGGVIANIASGAIAVLKLVASIAIAAIFFTAIITLMSFLSQVILGSVVVEFLAIVSLCLPFDAVIVFSGILSVITAILAFLVAKKVYDLTSNLISVSGH